MSKVVAYKEPTWFDETTDQRMWKSITRAYGLELELLDPSDPLEFIDGTVVVMVDEQGTESIDDFIHPAECTYVFGRTQMNNLMDTPHDHSVVVQYDEAVSLFGLHCVSVVLADRRRKL